MRAWQENGEDWRYCFAARAACAFQLTCRLSTPRVASLTENCAPEAESSWSISPCLEKAELWRYCVALSTA
jgi:hypothetical protein